ncbi:MAG: CRTAC1 family protein, partial [Planctomycetes bacterium]|nr:CRTAC1 family protein [Planctomycetota bacterium]
AGVRGGAWSCGVAIADYDADGDFDIYVLQWGPNILYRNNGDGTFTDVTSSAGVGDPRWSSSAAFADFNGDGLLDIYVANYVHFDYDRYPTKEKDGGPCLYRGVETGCGPWCYEGQRDTLYINVGQGRFEDRSNEAGLARTRRSRSFGVVAADFDGDGDVDVYVGCDVMENLYLENVGDATFVSVGRRKGGAFNGAGDHESGMGVAAADFDRTGTVDLLVTNFSGQTNTFYRNDRGILSDATTAIGLDRHPIEMGWGVCAQDFNQDALVDVFIANGHIYPQVASLSDPKESYAQRPRLYLQNRDGRLEEVPTAKAFGRPVSFSLRGCAAGDLDNDGDLDVVALQHNGPLVFFENLGNRQRKALVVELVDRQGGRSPMGARVRMDGGPWHWMLPNQGYQSSQDHRLYLPVRPEDRVTPPLEVGWPDGTLQRYQLEQWGRGVIRLRQRAAKPPT